ncbi:hypothetical protein H7X68_01900 [Candidatus Saccharibacteria bacterium]|nr:hypothetical protein [Candidatus Saccharibacteria bacterium]
MNKHRNYKPQVRKTCPEKSPETGSAMPESLVGYDELFDMVEFEKVCAGDDVETLPGVMMLRNVSALSDRDTETNDEDMRLAALATVKAIHLSIDSFKEQGFDLEKDRNAMSGAGRSRLFEFVTGLTAKAKKYAELPPFEQLSFTAQMNLFDILVANRTLINVATVDSFENQDVVNSAKALFGVAGEDAHEAFGPVSNLYMAQKRRLYQKSALNPSGFKNETHRQLMSLNSPQVRAFVDMELEKYEDDWLSWYEDDPTSADKQAEKELFAGQEVNFEILPPGTKIREYTEAIYDGLSESDKALVDIERVSALEKIRNAMGRDRCYYVHGKQSGKTMTDESGGQVNADYVGLVIQYHNTIGEVDGEDAIVISPIAKKHAGYLFRHDFSPQTSWRETLSKSKTHAKANGARPLKFTTVTGKDKYDAYVEKALELFTCPVGQFSSEYELKLKKNGEYIMRKRVNRSLGELAVRISSVDL